MALSCGQGRIGTQRRLSVCTFVPALEQEVKGAFSQRIETDQRPGYLQRTATCGRNPVTADG